MKIGIDIQSTFGKLTGIPRYTLNLMEALSRLADPPSLVPLQSTLKRDLRTYERFWWEAVQLPAELGRSDVDLIHVPGFGMRKSGKKKLLITAHDLIGYLFPKNLSRTARLYWTYWLPWCYRRADHLIADSFNTRNDLIEHLGIPEKKISVVYLAPDPKCAPVPAESARRDIRDALGIQDPFFLFVGTIEPRKNLVRTLKAYKRALDVDRGLPKLLVVGAKEWGTQQFEKTVKDLDLDSRVIATGFVADSLLWKIYSAALAVIFVSIYEGFGLPLVEGITCGVPVIASNNSSLEEIGKECAYQVDPYSENEIAKAILEIARDLALRRELREKGLKKAGEFSWEKAARETMAVYEKL